MGERVNNLTTTLIKPTEQHNILRGNDGWQCKQARKKKYPRDLKGHFQGVGYFTSLSNRGLLF